MIYNTFAPTNEDQPFDSAMVLVSSQESTPYWANIPANRVVYLAAGSSTTIVFDSRVPVAAVVAPVPEAKVDIVVAEVASDVATDKPVVPQDSEHAPLDPAIG